MKKIIVSKEVVHTTTGGTPIITVHLSKEAQEGLTIRHVPLPSNPTEHPYRLRVQLGDVVRLPKNKGTGEVYGIENDVDGHITVVSVRPIKKRRWWGLRKAIPLRFADHEINQLELISTEKEIEEIMGQLDEELEL